MKSRHPFRAGIALVATAALAMLAACAGPDQEGSVSGDGSDNASALLTIPREDMGTFSRNFNPFATAALPMTTQSIYEPMFIYSATNSEITPWLATEWTANDDATQVTFTLRDGVKWSDGEALTAQDVVTTFKLQKEIRGGFDYLDQVTAVDDHTVQFDFNTPYSPGLYEIGGQVIVPDHILGLDGRSRQGHEPGPGRYRSLHGGRAVLRAVLRPDEEPELLATRQAEDRGHPDARLPGQ